MVSPGFCHGTGIWKFEPLPRRGRARQPDRVVRGVL